ncbi:MAG: hypothetical protein ABJC26_05685 [Gemmatimonadaceae bacterium]
MYSTCLFCNNALGQNDVIEHFPVGRRLAYDAAKGRLWVVCKQCERWNLSPLETRWEAIEECERAFRATKLRASTDNVGLAQLADGLQLVRIGAPLRPEFAARRYGDQFGKRRRKYFAWMAVPIVGASMPLVGPLFGVAAIGAAFSLTNSGSTLFRTWRDKTIPRAAVRDNDGNLLRLTALNIRQAELLKGDTNGDWQLRLTHSPVVAARGMSRWLGHREMYAGPSNLELNAEVFGSGKITEAERAAMQRNIARLTGPAAERALATILPHINLSGGNKKQVQEAVQLASSSKEVRQLLRGLPLKPENKTWLRIRPESNGFGRIPAPLRLALEMSVHEEDERRAMEGELLQLEERWRDAEVIAKIADDMFVPQAINERVKKFGRHDVDSR